MVSQFEQVFPQLAETGYRVTSEPDRDYNCIAWAAGDNRNWWWPGHDVEKEFWPAGVRREPTREAFVSAFRTLSYENCDREELEDGFEKIAIYGDSEGKPTHAARQLADGQWTSKLGKADDIEHQLRGLEGDLYGTVVLVMKRRRIQHT